MSYGILSFGTALGIPSALETVIAEYTDDLDRVREYGYRTIHRAAAETGVTDLALTASTRALDAAGLAATDIDLLIFAPTDVPEYLYWDPAASLQLRLGATRARALMINQACTAGLAALDIIAGAFATHPDYRTALLVAGNRTCEPYWNRMDTQSMLFSDGAAAAVLRRDHDRLKWLASEALTDGTYSDFYLLETGGTAQPFTPETAGDKQPTARDAWDIMEFFDYDDVAFSDFMALINDRGLEVVTRACERIGIEPARLRYVVTAHDNVRSTTSLAQTFGIPVTATNLQIGLDVGHLGSADQIYSLARLVDEGAVAQGDLVALVGLGRGMHWACAVMEI
jgi:3-oxoacyl-[acyl-carrier-protein] synthase III